MPTERIPQSPPVIAPVDKNGVRPLWSVMIPAYNCSSYLKETLQSVLLQDTGAANMQIEVVDDCSTDADVTSLVTQSGKGRVDFYGQPHNMGSLRNFETCLNRSRGKLIHILHGDDQVAPGFYDEIEKLFNQNPSIGAAFTGITMIDEKGQVLYDNNLIQSHPGIIKGWLLTIAQAQRLRTCAIVVRRSVYEQLGGFFAVHYGEDWEMFVRIAATFPVAYSPKKLALYRLHENNISSRFLASGQNIKDIKTVIDIIQQYLPADKKAEIKENSTKNFSIYFANNAQGIYKKTGDAQLALSQAKGAISLHLNKTSLLALVKLYVKILVNSKMAARLKP